MALSDGATPVLRGKEWKLAQSRVLGPTVIYQDNKGVIILMTNGRNAKSRTRHHLNVRFFFVSDRIQMEHLSIVYASNGEMIADLMTKSVIGKFYIFLRSRMFGTHT